MLGLLLRLPVAALLASCLRSGLRARGPHRSLLRLRQRPGDLPLSRPAACLRERDRLRLRRRPRLLLRDREPDSRPRRCCTLSSLRAACLSPELARSLRLPRSLLLLLVADLLRSLLLCLGERHLARSLLRLRCALLPSLLAPSRVLPCCLSRSADALLGDALRLA